MTDPLMTLVGICIEHLLDTDIQLQQKIRIGSGN